MWRTLSLSLAVSRCPCVTRGSAERRTGSPGRRLGRPELRTACDVWRSLLHWSFVCVCVCVYVCVCVCGVFIYLLKRRAPSALRRKQRARITGCWKPLSLPTALSTSLAKGGLPRRGRPCNSWKNFVPARHGTVSTKAELMDVSSTQEFFGALLHETPAHITRFARIEATHL